MVLVPSFSFAGSVLLSLRGGQSRGVVPAFPPNDGTSIDFKTQEFSTHRMPSHAPPILRLAPSPFARCRHNVEGVSRTPHKLCTLASIIRRVGTHHLEAAPLGSSQFRHRGLGGSFLLALLPFCAAFYTDFYRDRRYSANATRNGGDCLVSPESSDRGTVSLPPTPARRSGP